MASIEWFAFWRKRRAAAGPPHTIVLVPRQERRVYVLREDRATISVPVRHWSPRIRVKSQRVTVGLPVAGRIGAPDRRTVLVSWALRPATMRESQVRVLTQGRDTVTVPTESRTVVVPRPDLTVGGF